MGNKQSNQVEKTDLEQSLDGGAAGELYAEGRRLLAQGERLRAEGELLIAQGERLQAEGERLLAQERAVRHRERAASHRERAASHRERAATSARVLCEEIEPCAPCPPCSAAGYSLSEPCERCGGTHLPLEKCNGEPKRCPPCCPPGS
jgi:hypothetical protein